MRSRRAIGSSAGLTDATGRAKRALAEMQIELQNMLDEINADRAARLDRSGRHAADATLGMIGRGTRLNIASASRLPRFTTSNNRRRLPRLGSSGVRIPGRGIGAFDTDGRLAPQER